MLWLLRHAEAVDGRPDEARPLTERGIDQAKAVGACLRRLGIPIDTCLASPKRRAVQTAQLACAPLNLEVETEPALAGAGFDAERLAAGHGETLIVGHNPTISTAVRELTGARVNLRTTGLAGVRRGELVVLLTPEQIGVIAAGQEAAA
ncbi:MAG TPA: phosphoglycerate mutase family protein [Solirubrobacteraceae bacterium]|nr:phosphoglycerate mutase family protein [Solirubrobacteraceae bacterium]